MLNSRLKVGDVLTGPFTATRVVGSSLACGLDKKNGFILKRDKLPLTNTSNVLDAEIYIILRDKEL